jgi:hypothetical protein
VDALIGGLGNGAIDDRAWCCIPALAGAPGHGL